MSENGPTWQPKHVKSTWSWKAFKGSPGSSAGGELTPSDKTWHPLTSPRTQESMGRGRESMLFHVHVNFIKCVQSGFMVEKRRHAESKVWKSEEDLWGLRSVKPWLEVLTLIIKTFCSDNVIQDSGFKMIVYFHFGSITCSKFWLDSNVLGLNKNCPNQV